MRSKLITSLAILSIFGMFGSLAYFSNYPKYQDYELATRQHPEFLPKHEHIQYFYGGFDQVFADLLWMRAVQYLGSNVLSGEYFRYIYVLFDLITDVEPAFEDPYLLGMVLLPSERQGGQDAVVESIWKLGEKGIANACGLDPWKDITQTPIEQITAQTDKYLKCSKFGIPYYLGYVAYWGKENYELASKYYTLASLYPEAPPGVARLAAVLRGKKGDFASSFQLFLSLASNDTSDPLCAQSAGQIEEIWQDYQRKTTSIEGNFIKYMEQIRFTLVEALGGLESSDCAELISKAVRQLNLAYLDQQDQNFFQRFDRHAQTPEELFEKEFISFIPQDFQTQERVRMKYFFNEKVQKWDYQWRPK